MTLSICCRDLGMDCLFAIEGETEEALIDSVMRHVQAEHSEDWFDVEEVYELVCEAVRRGAA